MPPPYLPHIGPPLVRVFLSVRARRVLESLGCQTIDDAARLPDHVLLRVPNFGRVSLKEVRKACGKIEDNRWDDLWASYAPELGDPPERLCDFDFIHLEMS